MLGWFGCGLVGPGGGHSCLWGVFFLVFQLMCFAGWERKASLWSLLECSEGVGGGETNAMGLFEGFEGVSSGFGWPEGM